MSRSSICNMQLLNDTHVWVCFLRNSLENLNNNAFFQIITSKDDYLLIVIITAEGHFFMESSSSFGRDILRRDCPLPIVIIILITDT